MPQLVAGYYLFFSGGDDRVLLFLSRQYEIDALVQVLLGNKLRTSANRQKGGLINDVCKVGTRCARG